MRPDWSMMPIYCTEATEANRVISVYVVLPVHCRDAHRTSRIILMRFPVMERMGTL